MNFLDYFRTVRVEILGFYSNNPDIIFKMVFGVFRLYGMFLESRIWPYAREWHLGPTYFLKNLMVAPSVQIAWLC